VLSPDDVRVEERTVEVVHAAADKDAVTQATAESAKFVLDSDGKLVVPPSLRVMPTDTEAVRKQKKKRIKKLKSDYRLTQIDEERNKRKNSWIEFRDKGPATKKARTSIFASPDTIEGKVGVVGSGQGLTEFKTQRYEPKKLTGTLPAGTKLQGDNPWADEGD